MMAVGPFWFDIQLDQDPLCPSSTFTPCILCSTIRTEWSVVYKTRSPCCGPGERSIYQVVTQMNLFTSAAKKSVALWEKLTPPGLPPSNTHTYSCPNKHVYVCICTHTMPLFVWNSTALSLGYVLYFAQIFFFQTFRLLLGFLVINGSEQGTAFSRGCFPRVPAIQWLEQLWRTCDQVFKSTTVWASIQVCSVF